MRSLLGLLILNLTLKNPARLILSILPKGSLTYSSQTLHVLLSLCKEQVLSIELKQCGAWGWREQCSQWGSLTPTSQWEPAWKLPYGCWATKAASGTLCYGNAEILSESYWELSRLGRNLQQHGASRREIHRSGCSAVSWCLESYRALQKELSLQHCFFLGTGGCGMGGQLPTEATCTWMEAVTECFAFP